MKATVRDLDGDDAGEVELPAVFETDYRPDLIKRAVLAAQANRIQDTGTDEYAGLRTPAESPGSGRGMAHVPRQNGRAREVPQAVSGRPAHPPKAEKDRGLDINTKERKLATRSAIAATANADRVEERGHEFDEETDLPLVVSDEFEDLVKTQEAVDVLEALGVYDDIERAEDGKTVRAGRGTTRGRKYTEPKSVLVVTSDDQSLAARNLAGSDVATADEVNVEDLAPGTQAGRLTLWTESALAEVAER
ncbi:50S ribosomal protein L4 [Natronomonas pharaonis DSM 2160]|uniref:Large ribosomal subunit protein uL4 n=1 Tax=Natronomonas pharaonis (strain ATCC 35678 / DSM 2160 / CIP 103997 / JCM 8858 / NBRC 14720 / NCIMB 2260 / Gabara) TaxID=348780 RepID=RL4_NATPD|nr:50S ribosomal protein L4 [Natronomonas pharaonis]Q3IMY7.1 RecName: Full=Large ribosomal subunit protein uL4; AltName: Full=50S ribosomal protein L4 [Natronomonas pharaonis DSM 2160]CAI50519.1 50S ribosomal protein L4 [Natronomonas pharaonis DSM 2160]